MLSSTCTLGCFERASYLKAYDGLGWNVVKMRTLLNTFLS